MARHDIIVMPSNSQYWHETFGIVSIEAQHAGCRVAASDDPEALAQGIRDAAALGPVHDLARLNAATRFTVGHSVDVLIEVLLRPPSMTPAAVVRDLEALALLPPPDAQSDHTFHTLKRNSTTSPSAIT